MTSHPFNCVGFTARILLLKRLVIDLGCQLAAPLESQIFSLPLVIIILVKVDQSLEL
jgi:hypothetical protein